MKIAEEDYKKLEEIIMHTRALLHLLTNTNKNKKGIERKIFHEILYIIDNENNGNGLIEILSFLIFAVNKILH